MRSTISWTGVLALASTLLGQQALATQNLDLHVGAVATVPLGRIERVAVGDDKILGTSVLDTGDLLIIPKAAGETEIRVWQEGGREEVLRAHVAPQALRLTVERVRALLQSIADVTVREQQGLVLIEGELAAPDVPRMDEILKAAAATGTLPANVVPLVKARKIDVQKMVRMDVKIVEVNRRALKNIGLRWSQSIAGPSVGVSGASLANGFFRVSDPGQREVAQNIPLYETHWYGYVGLTSSALSVIDLLQEDNEAKILAAPILSTRSGAAAKFLAGGEYPVPVASEFGRTIVEYKEYGIKLNIAPLADEAGNILAKVETEVSSIDEGNKVNGIPALLTRHTESELNVKNGETMVISGLVSAQDVKGFNKVPFLGDIPVLGELFRSRSFQQQETELVIFVTPRIQVVDEPSNTRLLDYGRKQLESFKRLDIDAALME